MKFVSVIISLVFIFTAQAVDEKVINHLRDCSVTIKTSDGFGSGIIITRKIGDETVNFIWTAAHVVASEKDGKNFKDVYIIQQHFVNNKYVGKSEIRASVIKYDDKIELALLRLHKSIFTCNTSFLMSDQAPKVGTDICHVGSFLGEMGAGSFTTGVISFVDRYVESIDKTCDQVNVGAMPGCSGGGIFLNDGRCIGLVLAGKSTSLNWIMPSRCMVSWTNNKKIQWAVDDKIKMPTELELTKIPIEN